MDNDGGTGIRYHVRGDNGSHHDDHVSEEAMIPLRKVEMGIELGEIDIDTKSEIGMQVESGNKIEMQNEGITIKLRQMEIDKEITIIIKMRQMEIDKEIIIEKEKELTKRHQIEKSLELEIEREKTKQMQLKDGNTSNSQPTMYSSEEGVFTTIAGSLKKMKDSSACTIAKSNRNYYDLFTVPCHDDTYIPNTRLRRLKNKIKSFEVLPCNAYPYLINNMKMQRAWEYPLGGSETIVNDPNLMHFLNSILSSYNRDHDISSSIIINQDYLGINNQFLFASEKTQPEYSLMHDNCVLLGSEAKGANASNISAGMQCFQLCADSAIELYRRGMNREDCVVPGVIICGEVFQIVGVYLISSTFPVMVNISSSINIAKVEVISRWVDVLKEFISETVTLLKNSQPRSDSSEIICHLDVGLFYKPIRKKQSDNSLGSNQRIILSRMMMIYDKLFHGIDTEGDSSPINVIQFPIGLITVPCSTTIYANEIRTALLHCINKFFDHRNGTNYNYDNDPCLIFHFLDSVEGWTNNRPDNDHRDSYILHFRTAINILNFVGVVHMDLRPANIMWRPKNRYIGDKEVELQIIDFEDALMVGSLIDVELARVYSVDERYPIKRGIDCNAIRAKIDFNNFFIDAIEAWLTQSDDEEFKTFMIKNYGTMKYYD